MKITVIYSSPRKDGNSDKLGASFVKGAIESGHTVTEFYIRTLKIHGCNGCEYCYEHFGECAIKDDMSKIYSSLYETDCIVFVTPIYYQNFPSQLKAVIDRLFISENKDFPIKKACLLSTYASKGKHWYKLINLNYQALCEYHGWENVGTIYVAEMDEKDNIDGTQYLEQAYELGRNIK